MPIQIACPNCAKAYSLADALKGKNVKCKNCAKVFLVEPVAAKVPAPAPQATKRVATTVPNLAKAAPKQTSPKPPADDDIMDVLPADDDDDLDDRPARKGPHRAADLD